MDVKTPSTTSARGDRVDGFEYAYTHENNYRDELGYWPISTDLSGRTWFSTRSEAEAAMANDLRWRIETFLIRRPKPQLPERVEL